MPLRCRKLGLRFAPPSSRCAGALAEVADRRRRAVRLLLRAAAMAAGGAAASAYSLGLANERLRLLEELEREIGVALQSAGARGGGG